MTQDKSGPEMLESSTTLIPRGAEDYATTVQELIDLSVPPKRAMEIWDDIPKNMSVREYLRRRANFLGLGDVYSWMNDDKQEAT